eukprot:jgi/Tetstr1/436228/TSEL_025073.t1
MARVQSSTPGGGVDWQFRCCDGGCGRTYRRPNPMCTHVNHGMESDDPEVAAMHLAYAANFDPSVYLRCAPRDDCPRSGHHVFHAGVRALHRQHAPAAASAAHDAALAATARCPAVVRKLAERRVRLWKAWDVVRAGFSALDTADLGMVSDAAAALPALDALHPPHAATGPEYSPPEEPPDLQRAPPSWGDNADEVRRTTPRHARSGKSGEPLRVRPLGVGSVLVRLASAHALGQVGADAREVMGPVQRSFQSGAGCETAYMSMRVALQLIFGRAWYWMAPCTWVLLLAITPSEWMTGALGRRREAHATLLERIASFGTSGYGCHHGAMRLLVVCAVRLTGLLSRMMLPSELDPFLEAVDAANISAAFSLLGMDACDQSTPRMEVAIVQMSMPADFGGLNLALLQSEAPAAFYSAQSVVLPKLVRADVALSELARRLVAYEQVLR